MLRDGSFCTALSVCGEGREGSLWRGLVSGDKMLGMFDVVIISLSWFGERRETGGRRMGEESAGGGWWYGVLVGSW